MQPEIPPAVEVDRSVNVHGGVTVGAKQICVGSHLAGQRVRIRLDGILLHVIDDAGHLRRPLTTTACARLRDARPAGPAGALAVPTDVDDSDSVAALFARVRSEWGRVDLLFNNAGSFGPRGSVDEVSAADWQATVAMNLTGASL